MPPGAEDSAGEHRDEQRGLHCTQPVAESVLVGREDQRLCCVVTGLAGMEGSVSLKRLRRGLVARHVIPTLAADRAAEIGPAGRGGREAGDALAVLVAHITVDRAQKFVGSSADMLNELNIQVCMQIITQRTANV